MGSTAFQVSNNVKSWPELFKAWIALSFGQVKLLSSGWNIVGKTHYNHMKFIQNKGKSVLIIGLCRNLAQSIKRNNVGFAG